jgi:hypothetical protein
VYGAPHCGRQLAGSENVYTRPLLISVSDDVVDPDLELGAAPGGGHQDVRRLPIWRWVALGVAVALVLGWLALPFIVR